MGKLFRVLAAVSLTWVFLVAATSAEYTLEGVVLERDTGLPIEGVEVTLLTARRTATTAEDGVFTFTGVEISGSDQLVITHPDYRTLRLPLGSLPSGSWNVTITLTRQAVSAEQVAPEGPRP